MKKYVTNDGLEFEASTPSQVIACLRGSSLDRGASKKRWMAETAERIFQHNKAFVKIDTDKAFVESLLSYGYLKEKQE